jgi:hypothetical protein
MPLVFVTSSMLSVIDIILWVESDVAKLILAFNVMIVMCQFHQFLVLKIKVVANICSLCHL